MADLKEMAHDIAQGALQLLDGQKTAAEGLVVLGNDVHALRRDHKKALVSSRLSMRASLWQCARSATRSRGEFACRLDAACGGV